VQKKVKHTFFLVSSFAKQSLIEYCECVDEELKYDNQASKQVKRRNLVVETQQPPLFPQSATHFAFLVTIRRPQFHSPARISFSLFHSFSRRNELIGNFSSSSGMLGSSFKFPAHSSFDCSLNQSDCALLSLGLLTGSDMEQFSHRTDSTATAKLILPQFRYFHSFLTRCFERLRSRYYHSWSSSL